MDSPGNLFHGIALFLSLFLLSGSRPGGARPIAGIHAVDHSATVPAVGEAPPKEAVAGEHAHPEVHPSPAAAAAGRERGSVSASVKGAKQLGASYGPLLLNLLPRGSRVPPSAPSGGINDIQA